MRVLILTAALIGGPAAAQLPVRADPHPEAMLTTGDARQKADKRLVYDFWRLGVEAHDVDRAKPLVADDYVEHDPTRDPGREGLLRFVGSEPRRAAPAVLDDLVRIVAEDGFVVLGFRRELPDLANEGQTYTTTWFEMFRVANGKIAEHWAYGTKE